MTITRATTSFRLLLWAALLLCGQTLALSHQHVDEAPGTSCAVCTLAKAETAACETAGPTAPARLPRWLPRTPQPLACLPPSLPHFEPRGPPRV